MKKSPLPSVLVKWIATYLLILLIPLGCFAYSAYHSSTIVRQQVQQSSQQALATLRGWSDHLLSNMTSSLNYVATQSYFSEFCQASTLEEAMNTGMKLQNEMKKYLQSIEPPIGVFLYHDSFDYLLCPECGTSLYAGTLVNALNQPGFNEMQWKQTLQAQYTKPSMLVSRGVRWNSAQDCLVLALTVRPAHAFVNIFITLPFSEWQVLDLDGRTLVMLQQDGSVLFSSHPDTLDTGDFLDLSVYSDRPIRLHERTYVAERTTLSQYALDLALLTDWGQYWNPLQRMRTIIVILCFLSLAVSIVLTVIFVQHNYDPVRKLLALTDAQNLRRNEFEHIENSVRLLKENASSMRSTLQQQSEQLRAYYILSALKGKGGALSDQEFMRYFSLPEKDTVWIMILLTLSDVGSEEHFDSFLVENEMMFRVTIALDKQFSLFPHDWVEDGRLTVCLLHLDSAQYAAWQAQQETLIDQMMEMVNQQDFSLKIVLGTPVTSFQRLRSEYYDATHAVIYLQTLGESGIMETKDYRALLSNPQLLKEERWEAVMNAISEGNAEEAVQYADKLFQSQRVLNAMTSVLKVQLSARLNELITLYMENTSTQEVGKNFLAGMETFLRAQDRDEMHNAFVHLVTLAASGIRQTSEDGNESLADKVRLYVEEHFADPALNITYLSDIFHRNPQTISRVFRARMGKGLLDYINEVRVEKAREIIRQTDASLETVASQVGFSSVRTFRRAFVKQFGILPSSISH